jgi:TnpA family transposase
MPKLSPRIDTSDTVEYRDLYDPPHFNENDRNYFFNLNDLETSTLKQFRIVQNKAHFILLLGYFKAKPVTLTFTWGMVKSDLTHIYARYFPKARLIRKNLNKDAKSNIYQKVFSLTGFQRFSEQHQKRLHKQADSAVAIRADNKTVFDECVTYLNQQWIALPALSRIQSIVSQALNKEEERLITLFNRQLKGSIKDYITALLSPHQTTDEFRTLRNQAKDFTFGEISRELQDKQKLEPIFKQAKSILEQARISDGNISFYSDMFQNYRTSQLKQFSQAKACIYVVSFLCQRYGYINDNLTNGFYRGLRKYGQSASQYSDKQIAKEASRLGKQVKKVSDVLHVLASGANDETMLAKALLNKIYKILPQSDLASVADFMEKVELDKKRFIWQYYSQNKATIRRNLRRLFLTLEFEIDKTHFEIKTIDEELIRNSDLAYLQNDDQYNPTVDPFLFECYLYRKVLQALDNDVCYIHDSHQYRPLDDYLIDRADQKQLSSSMSLPMLKVTISELSAGLKGLLEEQMKNTSKRINQGENDYVIYSDQTNTIKWSLSVKNPVPTVNNRVFEQFDQIGIIELMRVVNQKTNFFDEFTHFQSKYQRTKPNLNDILACILGNGTNFGLYKIANISDRSFNDLRSTQANYLRVETLRVANDAISNKTASLPIFEYYQIDEHGQHGSIDGQKFECRFSSLMARYSPKYFGQDKGVSAMTLVLNHIPANSKIISADDHESHHIFDLLYNNTSDVKPDILSTDTHGANRYNFAILHFFGYQFAPRYKTFKDHFEKMFQVESTEDAEQLISMRVPIDWELITIEWENICRLMISLGQHKTSQSVLIKKLCRYKSNTATLKALAEYDRAIKAQYILDYIDSETLRRHVQRALNRGEAFHQLRRVIAETNGKKFRGSHHAELTLWNECARLIANCVIHYNAQILSELKEFNEHDGISENLEALKRISPVAWFHINFSGFYSFADSENSHDFSALARNVHLEA